MAFNFGRPPITVSQEFAQWLGKLSGCNVVIQQKLGGGLMNGVRLYCTECHTSRDLTDAMVVRGERMFTALVDPLVAEFAKAHKHALEIPVAVSTDVSRRFRVDE